MQILEDTNFLEAKPAHGFPQSSSFLGPWHKFISWWSILLPKIDWTILIPSNLSTIYFFFSPLPKSSSSKTYYSTYEVAHQLLRHLKKAPGQVVLLKPTSNFQPKSSVDANWGACVDTRKPVIDFGVFLGESSKSWKSKKQGTISHSSAGFSCETRT